MKTFLFKNMELVNKTPNKWIICRICLKSSSGKMINIFDSSDLELGRKIEECGGISLNAAPNLPDSICSKCLTLLRAASKFREKIQRSQAELKQKFILSSSFDKSFEAQEESKEILTLNKTESGKFVVNKPTNTELITPEDNSLESDIEPLVYSVEYRDVDSEVIRVDKSPVVDDATFEVSKPENQKFDYVDQQDMDDLELVLNVEDEKEVSSFKIVPQFLTTMENRTKQSLSVRQRKRKTALHFNHPADNGETSHICPYCGNSYAEKAKLSLHMKIHTKEKPHQCEICFKRFGQTPQLARHMNSHTGSRPFLCKYCSASFADPSTRIKHERIHTNERPYPCTICGKAFSYSNVLKVHMMTHTGEKPYVCKYCGKQFSQAHHKNKHERLHENANLKLIKTDEDRQDIV